MKINDSDQGFAEKRCKRNRKRLRRRCFRAGVDGDGEPMWLRIGEQNKMSTEKLSTEKKVNRHRNRCLKAISNKKVMR